MANQVWPASLPQSPLIEGFQEKTPNRKVRFKTDQGPGKVRRKETKRARPFVMSFVMDSDQLDTFKTFYQETIKSGSLKFDFKDPRTQKTKEFRFKEKPPSWEPLYEDLYKVSVEMEMLPV